MSSIDVLNPFNNEKIKTLSRCSRDEAFKYLETAHAIYEDRSAWLSKAERIEILERFCSIVEKNKMELAKASASEGGKPMKDSIVEVQRGIEGVKVALNELHHLGGKEIPMGLTGSSMSRQAFTVREPRGVVFAISAFNHPFNLIIHQVIPALAAGCPVLVKPAATTPLSCLSIVDMLYEAGLPQDWCRAVLCENEVASEIVGDTRIGFLTFIGSARVGWMLRSKLAAGATCALEHGGVAPLILDETADLKDALPLITKGGFYHAGQVCVSVQRVYCPEGKVSEFIENFTAEAKKLKTGDQLDEATDVGPLISPKEVDRVHSWVTEAVEKGAKLVLGGNKISDTLYEPTILLNPPEDTTISENEVFGPVVCVYSYDNIDDAIARANSLDVSFQASIFTKNIDTAWKASRMLNGMAIMVNDHTAFRVDWMPFGGHKQSGMGVGGIGQSMEEMSIEKLIVFKSNEL